LGISWLISSLSNAGDEARETRERLKELTDGLEESSQAHQERRQEISNESQVTLDLLATLRRLQNQESMTNGERGESIRIIRELNDRVEGLNLTYNISTGFLDSNITAALGLVGHYERLMTATDNLEESQYRLNEITEEYAEIDLELETLREELDNTSKAFCSYLGAIPTREMTILEEQIYDLEAAKAGLTEETELLERKTNAATTNMVTSWDVLAWHHSLSMETMTESQRAVVEGFQSMYEIGAARLGDLTREFVENSELTWEAVQYNQKNIIAATEDHTDHYMKLVQAGLSEAYLQAIGADRVESLPLLREMMDECIEEVKSREQEWLEAHENNADTIIDGFEFSSAHEAAIRNYMVGGIRDTIYDAIEEADFPSLGEALPRSLMEAAKEGNEAALFILKEIAESWGVTVEDILDIGSPSKVFIGFGESIIQGLYEGLDSLKSEPIDKLQSLATAMKAVYDTARSDYQSIGQTMMDGLNA